VQLLPCSGQEFIQRRDDLPTFVAQRLYKIAELVNRYGDYLERMQDYGRSPDLEGRIEARMTDSTNRGLSHQGNNDSAAIVIKLRGLYDNNERDCILMLSGIPVYIELRH
jgi:hypothetical protein